jgi:single-strand DNA-binding protein
MAGSVNKAIILGRLGRDPELRYTQGNTAVCNFSIATDETWKDQSGQNQSRTEWHRIVVWGRQAEIANQYLRKGRQVFIEGRIQTREYQDREGNQRKSTEIVARELHFVGGQGDRAAGGAPDEPGQPQYGQGPSSPAPQGPSSPASQGYEGGFSAPQQGGQAPASEPPQQGYAPAAPQAQPSPTAPPADDFTDDDIPF